jgi:predicted DNA binding CopG/RHH family protein
MKIKLDKEEKEVERSASSYRPITKKKQKKIEDILESVRKSRKVNIRISEMVLEEIKKRSLEEGIPYQTLISSVLHKYVTNRLIDERAIRKSVQLMTSV